MHELFRIAITIQSMRKAKKLFIMLFWQRTLIQTGGVFAFWHLISGYLSAPRWSIDESLEHEGAKNVQAAGGGSPATSLLRLHGDALRFTQRPTIQELPPVAPISGAGNA